MWVPQTFGVVSRSSVLCLVCGAVRLFLDDRFERRTLCFHSNMTVVAERALRDMARNIHDRLIARAAFRKIRDERVPLVVISLLPKLHTDIALIKTLLDDEKIGAQIIRRPIEGPWRQDVANIGEERDHARESQRKASSFSRRPFLLIANDEH